MPANTLRTFHYLALGDSYTIGEMVQTQDNFPNQVKKILATANRAIDTRIIAKTGWTTDELEGGIVHANNISEIRPDYDFVSLLVGVNNQYRGRSLDNYRTEFEELLKKAIRFAGNSTERVVVLSIPDWGVTPFAEGQNRAQIAMEIDAYNNVNKDVALLYNIYYIDITPWTREAASDLSLIASDGLHPSAKEYQRWAVKIAGYFKTKIP